VLHSEHFHDPQPTDLVHYQLIHQMFPNLVFLFREHLEKHYRYSCTFCRRITIGESKRLLITADVNLHYLIEVISHHLFQLNNNVQCKKRVISHLPHAHLYTPSLKCEITLTYLFIQSSLVNPDTLVPSKIVRINKASG
jgi:hypothetical protein